MRRPSRLTLAAVAALVPLTLVSACSSDDDPIRPENGSGVDSESGTVEQDQSDDAGDNGGDDESPDPDEG